MRSNRPFAGCMSGPAMVRAGFERATSRRLGRQGALATAIEREILRSRHPLQLANRNLHAVRAISRGEFALHAMGRCGRGVGIRVDQESLEASATPNA